MAVEIRYSGETVTVRSTVQSVVAQAEKHSVVVESAVIVGGVPYSGSYEVTPSDEAQTLGTSSRMLSRDIIINPIPSNYGLITWDGTTITVS